MLIGRISKETTDVNRVTLSFDKWLDPGGTIETIQSSLISRDDSGWADVPPPWPLPDDITPLRFQTVGLLPNDTQVQMYLESGTPGTSYTVKLIIWDTANRQLTVELGVEIQCYPPNHPIGETQLLADGAVSRLGDEMFGPLYLYADPLQPNEAVNKNYADNMRRYLKGLIDDEIARAEAAEIALGIRIDNEITARIAADDAERAERIAADAQERADRIAADNAEAIARANADAALGVRIDNEINARIAADNAEATARANADNVLQTNINNEANTRAAADADLHNQIVNETNARIAADNDLHNQIVNETNQRIAADNLINTRIDGIHTETSGNVAQIRHGNATTDGGGYFNIAFTPAFNGVIPNLTGFPGWGGIYYILPGSFALNASGMSGQVFRDNPEGEADVPASFVGSDWYQIGY